MPTTFSRRAVAGTLLAATAALAAHRHRLSTDHAAGAGHDHPAASPPAGTPAATPVPPAGVATGRTHEIVADDFAFAPDRLTIAAGDTVRWRNAGNRPHDVLSTDDTSELRSTKILSGFTWSHRFETPGRFRYVCTYHPEMTGVIDVRPAPGAGDPDATPVATPENAG